MGVQIVPISPGDGRFKKCVQLVTVLANISIVEN